MSTDSHERLVRLSAALKAQNNLRASPGRRRTFRFGVLPTLAMIGCLLLAAWAMAMYRPASAHSHLLIGLALPDNGAAPAPPRIAVFETPAFRTQKSCEETADFDRPIWDAGEQPNADRLAEQWLTIIRSISADSSAFILVVGSHDARPYPDNHRLAARRARCVRNWLAGRLGSINSHSSMNWFEHATDAILPISGADEKQLGADRKAVVLLIELKGSTPRSRTGDQP